MGRTASLTQQTASFPIRAEHGVSLSFSNIKNHKDSIMTDTFRSSTSAVGQADIFKKWVQYFGATDPRDLDLGTLTAIHAWVMDGLEPNDQRQER